MGGQPFQGSAQPRVVDPFSSGLKGFGGRFRQVHGMPHCALRHGGWLYLELNARQIGKFVERHQLALQALLLVAQAGRPMPIGDN